MSIEEKISKFISELQTEEDLFKYIYNSSTNQDGIKNVYYSGPYWDEKEIIAAIKSLLTGKWLSAGESVHKFENEFSKKFNLKYSVMVNSGSSANLVMLAALKKVLHWRDNDEIILSVVGFPTTLAPILQNNLKPVFVDIEMNTLNIDLNLIEKKITENTRAIFLSPVLGNPPNMDKLLTICDEHKIQLILDDCDSLGSKWDGKYLSEYAIASSCSFYPSHHITTGEGGMVSSDSEAIIDAARSLSWWGRDCHPAGTKIYTLNGIKNIEDIVLGDIVYTHTGKYKKVYELFTKKYTGNLITFESKRNEDTIVTKKHPLYIKRNNIYSWIFAEDVRLGDFLLQKIPNKIKAPKEFNITYNTLVKTEHFIIPMEGDVFRLLGYYMAEGNSTSSYKGSNGKTRPQQKNKYKAYSIVFNFNINENMYIDDVVDLMKKYFCVSPSIRTSKNNNGISISFKTRKGYEFFNKYCGKLSYNKKLPWNFIHYNKNLLKEFIKGEWRGDGCNDAQSISIATTSETLVNQLRLILIRFGISPNILSRTPDKHTPSYVNGKKIESKHTLYTISCYGKNYKKISQLLDEDYTIKLPHEHTTYFDVDNKYALHEITNIYETPVINYDVYNFEVEDDHSYHANGIISHNCYCVGSANLLPCGTCQKRFSTWLTDYDGTMDHKYVFTNVGYNLKPLDMQGAIGLVQLEKFDEVRQKRIDNKNTIQAIFEKYLSHLVRIPNETQANSVSWFGVPIVVKQQEYCDGAALVTAKVEKMQLVNFLEKNKIQTRNYFAGNILLHPAYKHLDDFRNYPNANKVLSDVFFIGCSPQYTDEIISYIDEKVEEYASE